METTNEKNKNKDRKGWQKLQERKNQPPLEEAVEYLCRIHHDSYHCGTGH